MNRIFTTLGLVMLTFSLIQAQCTGDRYKKKIFTGYDKTSDIQYGENINLQGATEALMMDVYEPSGDTETSRPLIIMIHGGNFTGGDKADAGVLTLCEDFSQMGYVISSVNYRIGFENFPIPGPDSVDATETVVRTVHDIRAAIRYFKNDFTNNGNTYGIDTSQIMLCGVSAGAIAAVHTAYLEDENELPTYIDTTQVSIGSSMEGNSGTPGFTSSGILGVINLGGALRDTAWIQPNDIPLLSMHNALDEVVPYGTDVITLLGLVDILEVDGSGTMAIRADNIGLEHCLHTFPGNDHTPHVNGGAWMDTTQNLMISFMAHLVCGDPANCQYDPSLLSIGDFDNSLLEVYPNPTQSAVNISSEDKINEVHVYDQLGRLIISETTNDFYTNTDLSKEPNGIYIIHVHTENHVSKIKLIKE